MPYCDYYFKSIWTYTFANFMFFVEVRLSCSPFSSREPWEKIQYYGIPRKEYKRESALGRTQSNSTYSGTSLTAPTFRKATTRWVHSLDSKSEEIQRLYTKHVEKDLCFYWRSKKNLNFFTQNYGASYGWWLAWDVVLGQLSSKVKPHLTL